MTEKYNFSVKNPCYSTLGYVIAVANLQEKHDRSAPSDFHWKILKCRMLIFSNSSILASPDKHEVKRIHVIINKIGDDFDKISSLFLKFALLQEGGIREVTRETFQMCFQYTMTAKIAPVWNTIGSNYLINNRDFMITNGPQDGVKFNVTCNDLETQISLSGVKINFIGNKEKFLPGEWVRVLPSLNKAIVDEYCEQMPESARFKNYKDLRRHWKNIHGYRIPEKEGSYYLVQFWRGDPLTYPDVCVVRNFPTIIPVPKDIEVNIISRFLNYLTMKMPHVLGAPLRIDGHFGAKGPTEKVGNSQNISLCTPTQRPY